MTVSTADRVKRYDGDGMTLSFAVPFEFYELEVYVDGVLKTPVTHYAISGGAGSTGTVTFTVAPIDNAAVAFVGATTLQQPTQYRNFDDAPAELFEQSLDRNVMMTKEMDAKLARTFRLAQFSQSIEPLDAENNPNSLVYVNDDGEVELLPAVALGPSLAVAEQVAQDAAAAAAILAQFSDLIEIANGIVSGEHTHVAADITDFTSAVTSIVTALTPDPTPVGMTGDFAGSTAPDKWLFMFGQEVSRSHYSALFAVIGTTYGNGNGSTTFNLPDARGRVVAGKDNMGGTSANRLTAQSGGLDGDQLGAVGGAETHTLITAELAAHAHGATGLTCSAPTLNNAAKLVRDVAGAGPNTTTKSSGSAMDIDATVSANAPTISGNTASAGSGSAHNNVQPTIVFNKIIYTGVAAP